VDAAGRLLACGKGDAMGHRDLGPYYDPTPVAAMARIRVRSVAAGHEPIFALGWNGRVYSWGMNGYGQLGRGDSRLAKPVPSLVKGLKGVRGVAAAAAESLAVTQSGAVHDFGKVHPIHGDRSLRPITVEGFGERVRVRSVCA
jgi:alpha-tubulin suppressor-like RCC1 family protein